ncbi:transcriptional regulator, TetR family protein [Mycobacterium xenopi 4042]|uniref:Transcriptional regulator, TetR family protein n=1 Tax=Mycobacterium xenopi 4042 TaxID=1299334 RepID=X7YVN0_MYCXE|nr:transcriptional regulator, TetR family protein [Mycobacterium xenopi 4042]
MLAATRQLLVEVGYQRTTIAAVPGAPGRRADDLPPLASPGGADRGCRVRSHTARAAARGDR